MTCGSPCMGAPADDRAPILVESALWRAHWTGPCWRSRDSRCTGSDFADELERRRQRSRSVVPFRRAHFARVGGDVLGSLHAAQCLARIAADAVVMDLDR